MDSFPANNINLKDLSVPLIIIIIIIIILIIIIIYSLIYNGRIKTFGPY